MAHPLSRAIGGSVSNTVTFDYSGAHVLVTGGTSGIGHALATSFADAGATVAVTGTKSDPTKYETDLDRFAYLHCEMTEPTTVDAVAQSVNGLDVLVNNAGANLPGGRDEWEPEVFATALDLNLTGPMRLTTGVRHLLAASTLDGGGSVVNITSLSAFRSIPIVPGYGSAKAGLVALTGNLARYWVHDGIRVNAVAPGVIDTPMTAPMAQFTELLDAELAHTPMGRLGTPSDVVGAVLFLASSAARFITGHTLVVDGGYLLP